MDEIEECASFSSLERTSVPDRGRAEAAPAKARLFSVGVRQDVCAQAGARRLKSQQYSTGNDLSRCGPGRSLARGATALRPPGPAVGEGRAQGRAALFSAKHLRLRKA